MSAVSEIFSGTWAREFAEKLHLGLSWVVFLFLDFLDTVFCIIFRFLDEFMEGEASACCCGNKEEKEGDEESEVSETLYGQGRKNVFREMGFLVFPGKCGNSKKRGSGLEGKMTRWSDCGCESCVSWLKDGGDQKLHFVVMEPPQAIDEGYKEESVENVIFLHGFISSSSFWTETVFPNLSKEVKQNYRFFALDLLGFGRSPKPRNCLYSLKDHVEMIEKSVIHEFELDSFHLVAHSMGCIIALALAAKYSDRVKSITLVAPPCFLSSRDGASLATLRKLGEKRLWPLIRFGSSFMSWYEHLGRFFCFLFCRNHRTWEWILKLLTRKRDLHFMIVDMTRHTHSSAWHSMHNVICGGAKSMDKYLEVLKESKVKISVIQGDCDMIVPLECSNNIKMKVPDAMINIIKNVNHNNIVLGRENDFTRYLEWIWLSFDVSAECYKDCGK